MEKFQVAYIPIGVPTFHLESAQIEYDKSVSLLKSITPDVVCAEEMLLSLDKLKQFLNNIEPDLIILQNITFANSAYTSEVVKRFKCPVLLWTLREPVIDGGRLRLNSLTGAYSAANAMMTLRDGKFEYIYGGPTEKNVETTVKAMIQAAKIKKEMTQLKMAAIGHTPEGFGFGRALDLEIMKSFGVTLESIEARELIDKAKSYSDEECIDFVKELADVSNGLEETPEKNIKDFARLYKAYKEYVTEHNIQAISSRCWPDFFTAYGTPVCAVLAMLNELGVAASCEADVYGALSMYIGNKMTKRPVFFGDPVSLNEEENTITYWHCGTAACSLASEEAGAKIGVHPNRKIGPAMDFGCRPCEEVTVFRIGRKIDGSFRFMIASGEALDKPKQFIGTSVVVKTKNSSIDIVSKSVTEGWEPHFIVAYGNIEKELEFLGRMLNVEICKY